FEKYDGNGLNVFIECKRVSGLEPRRDWGCKDREKHEEMMDYLSSLRNNSSVHVAFPLFRFDVVCRDEVLYHYEVQTES
ncbi:hypothetical protein E2I00_012415, partial [Balaenoptera physalus]